MTQNPFLHANLEALKARKSPILPWLTQHQDVLESLCGEIFVNRFKVMDLPLPEGNQQQSLFSAMPPQFFYKGWEAKDKPDTSATVIVGCNLGHGVNKVLGNTPKSHKVIVLEPRPEMLGACLGHSDYSPYIASGKLHFIPPDAKLLQQVVQQIDLQIVHGRIYLRMDTPSQQLGPEYSRWGSICRHTLEGFAVEMTTMRKRQDVMVGNELGNWAQAFSDGSVGPLWGAGRGLAAVLLGAGPSLAEFGPALAASQGHALYVTGMQTLDACRRLGIKPHLCMAIDYSPGMLKALDKLDREWCADIPMIYSTKVLPAVVAGYPGPTIPLWTVGGIGTFALAGKEPILDAGGSVSVAWLRLLEAMDVAQVLLVGQDFGWKGDTSHAKGHHSSKRTATYDPKRHLLEKNSRGENVVTALPYLTAKRDMEKDIARMKMPVFNLHGGYLDIHGAHETTLDKAFAGGLMASRPGAMRRFAQSVQMALQPRPKATFESRSASWASSLRSVSRRLEKLFRKPGPNGDEIHGALKQVLFFIKQDKLYGPYLFNEIMDMSGLVHARASYKRTDLIAYNKLIKRILTKVRQMDAVLGDAAGGSRQQDAA